MGFCNSTQIGVIGIRIPIQLFYFRKHKFWDPQIPIKYWLNQTENRNTFYSRIRIPIPLTKHALRENVKMRKKKNGKNEKKKKRKKNLQRKRGK
jgi:hypothetical protein